MIPFCELYRNFCVGSCQDQVIHVFFIYSVVLKFASLSVLKL